MEQALKVICRKIVIIFGVFLVLFASAPVHGEMYIYELPDGSRMITDHALKNKNYRLIRTGRSVEGMGVLMASKNRQFFRVDPGAYDKLIKRMADQHNMEFSLVKAVMHAESSFNPYATSHKGASGLM